MSHTLRFTALVVVFALVAIQPLAAAHHGAYREEALNSLKGLEKKYVDLAEAVPDGKYTYRPGDGVRSVSEVYLHVAAANFGLSRIFGTPPPEGFDFRGMEKSTTEKSEVVAKLKESFAHMRGAIEKLADGEEGKATKMFGRDTTLRGALGMALGHLHEHLGQAIAYARVNGTVPPWNQ